MDELTLLRSTRDETIEPSREALTAARASLITVATTDRSRATRMKTIAIGRRWMPSRRGNVIAGALLVTGLVLTGATTVWFPALWAGPGMEKVDGDLILPVRYTTLSGESISCTYAAYLNPESGRTSLDKALSTLQNQDWTSFGDDVKQYALANPFTETGPEWASIDETQREKIAFDQAAAAIVIERSDGLLPADTAVLSTSDCSGRLT